MQAAADNSSSLCFPIRVLTERTGVGSSTLRAWERRYGLLSPQRTPKGHRLYGEADVRRVERILALLEEGHALPAIARRLQSADVQAAGDVVPTQHSVWADYRRLTLQAVRDFSAERLEAVYNEASALYPTELVTEHLIEPVLVDLGAQWRDREAGIAEEHFYSGWVRNRLGARFHHASGQALGARIVCACLPGAYHEIGLILFSVAALTRGYRVLYFGVDMPLVQIPPVQERSGARAVVLAGRLPPDADLENGLAGLAERLAAPLFVGGPASDQPLPAFEAAGGTRLGSRIPVAMKLLAARVPVHAGAVSARGKG